jgi:hypothetical protein
VKGVRAGTTLLELAVAVAASGIILTAGFGVADQVFRTVADDPGVKAAFDAAELRRTLSSWFGNTLMELDDNVYPFTGTSTPSPQIQALLGSATPYTPRAVIAKLLIDMDAKTADEGLIIQLTDPLYRTTQQIQLARDVAGMKVRYLVHVGGEALWTDVYTSSSELPRVIEIALLPRRGEVLHRLLELPILIPMTLQ